MLINKRHQSSIEKITAYSDADIASDHNPLTGTFKLKGKQVVSK